MRFSKTIISTTIISILLSTCVSFANSDIKSNQNIELSFYNYKKVYLNDTFNLETEKINEESEFLKSNMSYPYLQVKDKYLKTNDYNIKVIENINEEILDYIVSFSNKVKKESEEYKKEYENILSKSDKEYVKYQYEAYSDYKISYNKNNLISIPIKTYEFTGGAHGMSYLNSYNYDLLSGKKLKLKDLFNADVNYKNVVDDFIKKEISKKNDIYFTGNEGFKGIKDNQSFYIDSDGIVIYFQLYEIAPYYVGIPEFKMSWKEFGKYLNIKD